MNDKLHNDDILFDRLVDGELSAAERRALLESLDARPDGWRRCALAFLEAQSWRNELRQVAGEPPATAAAATKTAAPTVAREAYNDAGRRAVAGRGGRACSWRSSSARWQREHGDSDRRRPGQDERTACERAAASRCAAPNAAKPSDALNLWVRDDAGQMRRVRVPLVDASALDNELGMQFQTGVPDDVRNRLHDHGYTVQSKRQYAPLWLENGRPMIVPVEDTKIVPVSNKVY